MTPRIPTINGDDWDCFGRGMAARGEKRKFTTSSFLGYLRMSYLFSLQRKSVGSFEREINYEG